MARPDKCCSCRLSTLDSPFMMHSKGMLLLWIKLLNVFVLPAPYGRW